jgi:hypothetical protein
MRSELLSSEVLKVKKARIKIPHRNRLEVVHAG